MIFTLNHYVSKHKVTHNDDIHDKLSHHAYQYVCNPMLHAWLICSCKSLPSGKMLLKSHKFHASEGFAQQPPLNMPRNTNYC
jgi:hypothetical protein